MKYRMYRGQCIAIQMYTFRITLCHGGISIHYVSGCMIQRIGYSDTPRYNVSDVSPPLRQVNQARAVSDIILPRPRLINLCVFSYRAHACALFSSRAVSHFPTQPLLDDAFCQDRASLPSPNLECGQPLLDSLAAVGGSGPAPVAVDGSD